MNNPQIETIIRVLLDQRNKDVKFFQETPESDLGQRRFYQGEISAFDVAIKLLLEAKKKDNQAN